MFVFSYIFFHCHVKDLNVWPWSHQLEKNNIVLDLFIMYTYTFVYTCIINRSTHVRFGVITTCINRDFKNACRSNQQINCTLVIYEKQEVPHCRNSSNIPHCRNSSNIPHCQNSSNIPHCRNSSNIPHCQNSSKIPHCQNSSNIPHCQF